MNSYRTKSFLYKTPTIGRPFKVVYKTVKSWTRLDAEHKTIDFFSSKYNCSVSIDWIKRIKEKQ